VGVPAVALRFGSGQRTGVARDKMCVLGISKSLEEFFISIICSVACCKTYSSRAFVGRFDSGKYELAGGYGARDL